jgi:secreted trypsin-like serine protease
MHLRRLTLGIALVCFAATGCVYTGSQSATGSAPIIGGTTDSGDPGVVLIFAQVPGAQNGALCTGEVISPHVILTAAHCVSPAEVGANAAFHVLAAPDFNAAQASDFLTVKETHFNTLFDPNNLNGGNDVGVVILNNPISAPVLPLNRAPLTQAMVGQPVRFVGYGLSDATAQAGAGLKRQTTTTLTDFTDVLIHFSDGAHETCNGDSGGPAFMTLNGTEVVVGLTSFGDVSCSQGGFDTRVDAMLSFIDPFVAANDPGSVPATGSAAGGTASPTPTATQPAGGSNTAPGAATPAQPTLPAAPNPAAPAATTPAPSSALAGYGQVCQHDSDCASKSCGLGTSGTLVCVMAATDVNGGCSTAGRGGHNGADLVWLLLPLAALCFRRRRTA